MYIKMYCMQWNFTKQRIFTCYTIKRGHLINGIGYFNCPSERIYFIQIFGNEDHVIVTEPLLFLKMWRQTMIKVLLEGL